MNHTPNYATLPVNEIRANSYNPNEMTQEEFDQYKQEVKRLGRIPKPCVVRRLEDGSFEIIDGQHSWMVATELGMETIDCVIVEVDDFEAMTQTYKRNRGGKDNPVKLANMFVDMKKVRKLSTKKLAAEIGIPEATIRSNLDYLKVLKSRNRCAGGDREEEVSDLTRSQVRTFNSLPDLIANKWLDAGGYKSDLPVSTFDQPADMITDGVSAAGLAEFIDTNRFRMSLLELYELARWQQAHCLVLEESKAYLRPVAEGELGVWVMSDLPCRETDGVVKALISTKQWQDIVTPAADRDLDAFGLRAAIQAGVRLALTENGHDLADVQGPEIAEKLQIAAAAPEYIRNALLSLDEQVWLAIKVEAGDEDVETVAKNTIASINNDSLSGKKLRKAPGNRRIGDIFADELRRLTTPDRELDDADVDAVAGVIGTSLNDASVADRPAIDVLRERLEAMEWPEFYLIAALAQGEELNIAASQWLAAMQDEATEE